jgi:hypothetical protein
MEKKVLTEQALYYGNVSMPKGFEIDHIKLSNDIIESIIKSSKIPYLRNLDMLDSYIREHIKCDFRLGLVTKNFWGNIYKPKELTEPLLNINPMDLNNSADFTLLYGVKNTECLVKFYYDDNRIKGNDWTISLNEGSFVMFPSINKYIIKNNHKKDLSSILTITYELK